MNNHANKAHGTENREKDREKERLEAKRTTNEDRPHKLERQCLSL